MDSEKQRTDSNHPDFVPNVYTSVQTTTLNYDAGCKKRATRLNVKDNSIANTSVSPDSISTSAVSQNEEVPEKERPLEEVKMLQQKTSALRKGKVDIQKLSVIVTTQSILKSSSKLHFYTGLPSIKIFHYILSFLSGCNNNVKTVPLETQLLIVLMKLKLNLLFADLAYRFQSNRETVHRIFDNIVPPLAKELRKLIMWPSDSALENYLPDCFKNSVYKDAVCIIHCIEISIPKPSNLQQQAQTWSAHKHEHTIKILVGMNPTGAVCFISRCWGGRTSPTEIALKNDLLNKIKAGNIILADREFIDEEIFAAKGAKLIVPDVVQGTKHLGKHQVTRLKKISKVKRHVHRVVTRMNRFQILQATFPSNFLEYSDSVIILCAALLNISCTAIK